MNFENIIFSCLWVGLHTAYVMSCDYVKRVVALKIYTLDSFEEVHCVIGLSAISKKKKKNRVKQTIVIMFPINL